MDRETLKHICSLARISSTEAEFEELAEKMEQIFKYISLIDEIDVEGVPPCYNVIEHFEGVLREDETKMTLSREDFLANSPAQISGLVRVPPVINA